MGRLLFSLGCLVSILQTPGRAQAQAGSFRVESARVDGTQRVDAVVIRDLLGEFPRIMTPEDVSEEVKQVYQTGYFDQVTAEIAQEESKDVFVVSVVEKPLVRKVFIEGNDEVSEDDLGQIFSLGAKRFLDQTKVKSLIETTRVLYQSRGYYDAEVSSSVVPIADNQVDLTVHVKEGERYSIDSIIFRGLKNIDEDELRDVIQTKVYKWWSSWVFGTGRLAKEVLENDKQIIRQYFLDHGFLDATLSEPVVTASDGSIQIVFDVSEGQQYHVGEISVSGDLVDNDSAKTLDGIQSETGAVFKANVVREDAFRISDKFTDKGFAFANVTPLTEVSPALEQVNLNFQVDQGEPVTVDRIRIRGNTKTYDHVIRRELRIGEQELYQSSKIRRSETLLRRLGFFDEADISNQPTDDPEKVDLLVNVREASTGTFSVGAGYSTSDGLLFNTRLAENNLMGTGRRAVLNGDIGTERENVSLSFQDPRLNDSYWDGTVQGYLTSREFRDFDRELDGGSLRFGYPLEEVFGEAAQDIKFFLEYEYFTINIKNVNPADAAQLVLDSEGTSSASGVVPRLVRSTINNPLDPTDGSRQEVSFELTGLGATEEYYLFEVSNTIYTPVIKTESGPIVFSMRNDFGYGDNLRDGPFPLFRRYFPGGINSVRGYDARTLGPKDSNGNEYGGSKQFVNNFELIFPLASSAGLKGVFFYDIGQAFDDDKSIRIGDLREAYGAGFRWASPLGPIRIELGFPIDRQPGEKSMVTMFSFGAPF